MVGQPQLITDFCGFTLFQELCIIFYEPALSPDLSEEVTQTAQSDHSHNQPFRSPSVSCPVKAVYLPSCFATA